MKKVFLLAIISLITISIQSSLLAQNISIRKLSLENQLSEQSVQSIYQDDYGYVWFGTPNGLYRFDSHNIKHYNQTTQRSQNAESENITKIVGDFNNNLLIGTKNGLNILNRNKELFELFPDSILHNKEIKDVLVASDSSIWIGTTSEALQYSSDFKLMNIINCTEAPNKQSQININSIFEDSYKNIWLLSWKEGVLKYNQKSNQLLSFPTIGDNNNPFTMFQDSHNNYWIGTWGDGLYRFYPNANNQSKYKPVKVNKKHLNEPETTFYSFAQDNNLQYIWAVSLSGLHAFCYSNNETIEEVNFNHFSNHTHNIFSQVIKDRSGSIWIGSFVDGPVKIDFNRPHITNSIDKYNTNKSNLSPLVTKLCKDGDGDLWINQERLGLIYLSSVSEKPVHYSKVSFLKEYESLNDISTISYLPSRNEIWIAPLFQNIILQAKKQDGKIKNVVKIDLLKYNDRPGQTQLIFEDQQRNVWTSTKNSFFCMPADSDSIKLINDSISNITSITQDLNGNIWLSNQSNRLYQIPSSISFTSNNLIKTFYTIPSIGGVESKINNLAADNSGNIWITTSNGQLMCFNPTTKKLSNQTQFIGINDKKIINLNVDKYDYVWLSTSKSIIQYNPKNNSSYQYSFDDGMKIKGIFGKSSFLSENSNEIYYCGDGGFSCLYPTDRLNNRKEENSTLITDIKIDNQSISQSFKANELNSITVGQDCRNVEIFFSSLNYSKPEKIKYAYKMIGIDEDWVTADNSYKANYKRLPKGEYTFVLKCTNAYNIWSDEKPLLQLKKLSKLAYSNLFYFLLIASVGFLIAVWIKKSYFFQKNTTDLNSTINFSEIGIDSDTKNSFEINPEIRHQTQLKNTFIDRATSIVEKNMNDFQFDINVFASQMNMSKSSLYRKIKAETDLSPIEFIKQIKLLHAYNMLSNSDIHYSEVAYSVGFSDAKYFSSCFKQQYNITPKEFQRKMHIKNKAILNQHGSKL